VSQGRLYIFCHSGLDKPAPYLIRGNPVFFKSGFLLEFIPMKIGAGMTAMVKVIMKHYNRPHNGSIYKGGERWKRR
jgi:hypothetical protein